MNEPAHDGLPRFALRAAALDPLAVLQKLQGVLLAHPVAAQAAFAALIAEGRRFAETPAGRSWQQLLVGSPLLRRARAPWDAATLWMLEEGSPDVLPSAFVDALCSVAQRPDAEAALERMLTRARGGSGDEHP